MQYESPFNLTNFFDKILFFLRSLIFSCKTASHFQNLLGTPCEFYQKETDKIEIRETFFLKNSKMNEILENEVIYADKLAVFTCNDETDFREIRFYFIQNWKILTRQMDGSTFLFLAGVHGSDSGKLGEKVDIQSLKNQFSHRVLKSYNSEWILEDKEKRNIKFEFLDIPDFFKDEETKEIDKNALVLAIRSIDSQVTIMVICYFSSSSS